MTDPWSEFQPVDSQPQMAAPTLPPPSTDPWAGFHDLTPKAAPQLPVYTTPPELPRETANEQNARNPLYDYQGTVMRNLGHAGTSLIGLVAPETAANLNKNIDEYYGTESQGIAGKVGGGVSTVGTVAATIPAGPVGMAALYGAQGAGGVRADIAERRQRGEQISGGEEAGAAGATGLIDAFAGFIGGKVFGNVAGKLAQIPGLKEIAAKEGAAGVANLVKRLAPDMASQAGTMAVQTFADNVVKHVSYAPETPLGQGVGEAALTGAVLAPLGGAVHGAMGKGRALVSPAGETAPPVETSTSKTDRAEAKFAADYALERANREILLDQISDPPAIPADAAAKPQHGELLRDKVARETADLRASDAMLRDRSQAERQMEVEKANWAAAENPELFKIPEENPTPERIAAINEQIRREADIAEANQQAAGNAEVSKVPETTPKSDGISKKDVMAYAGENVDRAALSRVIADEPGDFVRTTVTPADFRDIPRSNLDISRAQEFATRTTQAPPVIATMDKNGNLQIRDGRHRLIAAALKEQATVGDPNSAKVDAIVPRRWLEKNRPTEAPKQEKPRLRLQYEKTAGKVPTADEIVARADEIKAKDPSVKYADAKRMAAEELSGAGETKTKLVPVPRQTAMDHGMTEPKTRQGTPRVQEEAADYAKTAGIDYQPNTEYAKVDEAQAQRIADAYDAATHSPNDPKVKASYDAFKKETKAQWDYLKSKGVKMEPWTGKGQPYKNSAEMIADVRDNKHLSFFTGGEMPADHPLAEMMEGGITYNDAFRAVHDYFGHAKEGNQFGPRGEENAWRDHVAMYSPEARGAMTAETRGQNSWVNFGPKGKENRANPGKTTYAEQKATLLPEEFSHPTVPSVENAPKAEGSEPAPPIKHAMGAATAGSIAGSRLSNAVAAITGHAKGAGAGIANTTHALIAKFSRNAMPNTTRLSEESGNKGVRFAAAVQSVEPMTKAAVSEVLPQHYNDKEFRIKLGAVLVEGRLQAERQKFIKNGQMAEAQGVGTLIGAAGGSPFKTLADYKAARADPRIQDAIARHKTVVQGPAEDIHKELGGKLSVLDEDGAFINLKALDPTDPLDKRQMPMGPGRGNLRNPRLQKSAFAIPAKGDAQAYQLDYAKIVENTLGRNAERYTKKQFVNQLVADGLAKILTPREAHEFNQASFERWPTINGRRAVRLEGVIDYAYAKGGEDPHAVQVKKDLYMDPRIEAEVRAAFNVDKPIFQKEGLNIIPKIITHAQLMGPVDFVYHTARIFAQISNSPGGKTFVSDLARKVPGVNVLDAVARVGANLGRVIQDSPAVRQQIAELAKTGAMREGKGLLGLIDKAGRLALDNMYDNLVDRGLTTDSERGRRNFSNQIGQYNGRLQTRIVRELKESGASPFITAGLSGNLEGIKAAMGSPVVEGKTKAAQTQLVATQLAGHIISLGVIPGVINMVTTGTLTGRPGTPLGAIDTGKKDKDGKPISIDPLKWIGVRRGLRVTGIDAAAERLRTGGSPQEALNDAWRQALQAWVHPFAGPAVQTAAITATGYEASGRRVAPVVRPGESQVMENFKTALEHINPTVGAFVEGKAKGGTTGGINQALGSLSSAVGVGSRKPVAEGAKQGAELNDFRDDLKRRAKQVNVKERMKFIREELKGMPSAQKAKVFADIQEHPHSWFTK